jgi:hypothetical protein
MHTDTLRAVPRRAILALALAVAAPAQVTCANFGSTPIPATTLASPLPLGCSTAAAWPQWHLLTPAHRAPAPHPGHAPGNARALPRLLVRYRCTGLLLLPAVPIRVRTMGYVLDQPEYACAITP